MSYDSNDDQIMVFKQRKWKWVNEIAGLKVQKDGVLQLVAWEYGTLIFPVTDKK